MITLALTTEEMAEVLKRDDIIYVKDAGKTQVEPGSLTVVCVSPTLEKLIYKLL
jgi:peptidyl-tRNA hydrolase